MIGGNSKSILKELEKILDQYTHVLLITGKDFNRLFSVTIENISPEEIIENSINAHLKYLNSLNNVLLEKAFQGHTSESGKDDLNALLQINLAMINIYNLLILRDKIRGQEFSSKRIYGILFVPLKEYTEEFMKTREMKIFLNEIKKRILENTYYVLRIGFYVEGDPLAYLQKLLANDDIELSKGELEGLLMSIKKEWPKFLGEYLLIERNNKITIYKVAEDIEIYNYLTGIQSYELTIGGIRIVKRIGMNKDIRIAPTTISKEEFITKIRETLKENDIIFEDPF